MNRQLEFIDQQRANHRPVDIGVDGSAAAGRRWGCHHGGGGFRDSEEPTARDLVRQLSLHAYAGGKRVFVLGDADFTREAANALLKFFEEPPAGVLLIVTTSALGR